MIGLGLCRLDFVGSLQRAAGKPYPAVCRRKRVFTSSRDHINTNYQHRLSTLLPIFSEAFLTRSRLTEKIK